MRKTDSNLKFVVSRQLAARVSKPALRSFKVSNGKKHTKDGRNLGVENKEWQTELKCFVDGKPVPDKVDVKTWDEKVTAAWVGSLNEGEFAQWADHFLFHKIDGPLLLNLYILCGALLPYRANDLTSNIHRLEEIGIKSFGDRLKLSDLIAQLKRRWSKPRTAKLRQPSWPGCIVQMLTFRWADTRCLRVEYLCWTSDSLIPLAANPPSVRASMGQS
eukprot:746375-Hanusia_phi.AAC.2